MMRSAEHISGAVEENIRLQRYPQAGETYESCLYPGQQCGIVSVIEAKVTFRWLPPYQYIDEQTAPVNQFIVDFRTLEAGARSVQLS